MATKTNYNESLKAAQIELAALLEQREKLDRKIAQQRHDIASLAQLARKPADQIHELLAYAKEEMGLMASIRHVLKASANEDLTASEVMDGMIRLGLYMGYKNLLPSIHTTLRRMAEGVNSEVVETTKDNKKAYRLRPSGYIPSPWLTGMSNEK